ncbi:MAG: GTPase/DUF3482 domain-containing protein [Pseudomonadota bacterium]|nr:MAG: GTPase/DUF3482 domain-containing protein [Pseudomonadota bacterium]
MNRSALRIAVVGHTNTGKTSLVRTLTHDRAFGEIADRGGTTRQVAAARLADDSGTLIELFDSPGLESAPALIEWLERQPGQRHDGPMRIRALLENEQARGEFDQESRVLELMLGVDVGLYVIDAREPVLEKYQDELAVLALCARPLVAVLNFTAAGDSREREWRDALARVNLHSVLAFDAAVRDPATELRLFEKLRSLLDEAESVLTAWLVYRRREEQQRLHAACQAVADLLIDAAAVVRETGVSDAADRAVTVRELQDAVREREQACVNLLLELFRFGPEDYRDAELPLTDGRWSADLFDSETLRQYGLSTSRHAAAGAGAGAVVDVGTGGLSLGAGTLAGAAIGAGIGLVRSAGARLVDRARGREQIRVDDATLRLLAARHQALLKALQRRGHGSAAPISQQRDPGRTFTRLPGPLRRARHRPRWSTLNGSFATDSGREATREALVRWLAKSLAG